MIKSEHCNCALQTPGGGKSSWLNMRPHGKHQRGRRSLSRKELLATSEQQFIDSNHHGLPLQTRSFAPEVLRSGAGRPVRCPPLQLRCVFETGPGGPLVVAPRTAGPATMSRSCATERAADSLSSLTCLWVSLHHKNV